MRTRIRPDEATYFLYDHLGNTRVAFRVDGSNVPTIINALDYYSYGKVLREYDNGAGDRYLTTQHERDKETGLDYRGARYYDSDIARFLSTDPWADKYPSWSTYNYVMGNPNMFIDPTGKGAENVFGGPGKKPPGDGNDGDDKGKGDGKGHNQPKYIPAPKELPGFPGAEKLPNKKGMRPGWKLPSGNLGEWDSQHGEVEVYDKTGKKHKGAWDPDTGEQIKDPVPGRTATRSKMESSGDSSKRDSDFYKSDKKFIDQDAANKGTAVGAVILTIVVIVLIPIGL